MNVTPVTKLEFDFSVPEMTIAEGTLEDEATGRSLPVTWARVNLRYEPRPRRPRLHQPDLIVSGLLLEEAMALLPFGQPGRLTIESLAPNSAPNNSPSLPAGEVEAEPAAALTAAPEVTPPAEAGSAPSPVGSATPWPSLQLRGPV